MAALCGLGNMSGLIDKICVIHDQEVGVYGFVFHRGKIFEPFCQTQKLTQDAQMASGNNALSMISCI